MSEQVLPREGPAAPPRANGELAFAAPWESRIFGLTMALFDAGRFEWSAFQALLIEAIGHHEAALSADLAGGVYDYYGCWLEAFRRLAGEKAWVEAVALEDLERALALRPARHDHG